MASPRTLAGLALLAAACGGPVVIPSEPGDAAATPDATAADAAVVDATIDATRGVIVPTIDGPWWDVAGNPDLGMYTSSTQQPVDFGIWQAADGSWHIWSCIRGTSVGGETRLFYHWRGDAITATSWSPVGIAMQADPSVGETPGGLQAPFVLPFGGGYRMFYGDWERICEAQSTDGVVFTRMLDAAGSSAVFSDGPTTNTRDPMVLQVGAQYFAYYTSWDGMVGADYVRTSTDLRTWSAAHRVAAGGAAGTGGTAAECPFVVFRADQGAYYLFRTQHYGADAQTSVYRSTDPMDFGVDDDRGLVGTLPVAAPEIVTYAGQTYIAALRPGLDGIHIARLAWRPR